MTTPAPGPTSPLSRLPLWAWITGAALAWVVWCCAGVAVVGYFVPRGNPEALLTSPTTSAPGTPTATTPTTAPPPTSEPPAPDWPAVAAIVTGASTHYRQLFAAGKAAFGTSAFAAWYQSAMADDGCNTARIAGEDVLAGADDGPLITWYEDCSEALADINLWGTAAAAAQPGPVTGTMTSRAATVTADLVLLDADVAAIGRITAPPGQP